MGIKKRKQGKTRLSGRNTRETLNDLVQFVNRALPEAQQLQLVRTQRDLYELRQRMTVLSMPQKSNRPGSPSKDSTQTGQIVPQALFQALAAIATNAWRAQNKMVDENTGEAKEEMKRVYRHIEALLEVLGAIGIEIRDMQGRCFDSGMALKVITFEPTPGLAREEITETIKPTITWQGQLIQMGEVVVGTPDEKRERKGKGS